MRMQLDELPQDTPDVDYAQILPIQQKRTIAFINHFIMNTVSYLNNLAQSCESRFMEFEYKIQKIEASLLILEAQLSSIPELEKSNISIENTEQPSAIDTTKYSSSDSADVTVILPQLLGHETEKSVPLEGPAVDNKVPEPEESHIVGKKAREDPRYTRFFKMLRVGVQEQAVKIKMKSEGIDPSILDNPEAIIPEPDSTQENDS